MYSCIHHREIEQLRESKENFIHVMMSLKLISDNITMPKHTAYICTTSGLFASTVDFHVTNESNDVFNSLSSHMPLET